MRFSALATDFDGTIADRDRLDPDVRRAIAELRQHGVTVILATGRILADLERVVGDLTFVDAIVAENGAVVTIPSSGYRSVTGHCPSPELFSLLDADGIEYTRGEVVVETDAKYAVRLVDIIQHLELPLVLAFNRSRLMLLPQSVSKATGVRQALSILRLSPRNTLAIGDAENDHELLSIAEVGVAVAWGSQALRAVADHVLPGSGPSAVAPYLRSLAPRLLLPAPLRTRRQLTVGRTAAGEILSLAVRGRNVLVAGDPKSGKSWVTGLLAEQLILHGYSLCIFDPEGDYRSLEALPGVTVLGGAEPLPSPVALMRTLRHSDVSTVVDLSHAGPAEKLEYVRALLLALTMHRRHCGLPHRVVLDEAHYFLHDEEASKLLDLDLNGYTVVSYRASRLHPTVLASAQAILVTRESDSAEVRALTGLCGHCALHRTQEEWRVLLGGLQVGEVVLLPVAEEAHGAPQRIQLAPRLTPHVRHVSKYADIPVLDSKAFVFWSRGLMTGERARSLREFTDILDRSRVSDADGHIQRSDFSRWIAEVFGDFALASTIRRIEEDYRRHTRSETLVDVAHAIRNRYELTPAAREPRRSVA